MTSKRGQTALSVAYARIVDALMIATGSRPHQRWLITGVRAGDGCTTTGIGIARDLAARNSKVLLIDANFRNPSISRNLDNPSTPGLAQAITEQEAAAETCQKAHRIGGFAVMGVGDEDATPLELFADSRTVELLDTLAGQFDVVVIDTAALEKGLEAISLAPHVDGCVLIVRAARTGKGQLESAKHQIEQAGGKVLGAVLNRSLRSF